jgi:hypothetical protein
MMPREPKGGDLLPGNWILHVLALCQIVSFTYQESEHCPAWVLVVE